MWTGTWNVHWAGEKGLSRFLSEAVLYECAHPPPPPLSRTDYALGADPLYDLQGQPFPRYKTWWGFQALSSCAFTVYVSRC